jgi:hypothetical protein
MSSTKLQQEFNRIVRSSISLVYEIYAAVFIVQSLQKLRGLTACVQSGHQLVTFYSYKRHVKVKLLLYTPEDLYLMEVWPLSFLV